jgi:signal peptidase II
MNRPSVHRTGLVMLIVCACVLADLGAKAFVRERLAEAFPRYYLGGLLRLSHWENTGTVMSLGDELPESLRFWMFTVAAGLMGVGLIAVALVKPGLGLAHLVALSLIAGGTLSNVIDRLLHDGRALDFINIVSAPLHWMIFNLADVAIALGAVVLVILLGRRLMLR